MDRCFYQCWLLFMWISTSCCRDAVTPDINANDIAEARLSTKIMPANRIMVRPAKIFSETTNVFMELRVVHIIDLETAMQEVKLSASFFLTWDDPFMTWNPEDFDNITSVRISGASVWKPEFTVLNSMNERLEHGTKKYLRVNHKGRIIWQPKDILQLKCEINPVDFPFDTQTCNITIMMLNVPEHEAKLTARASSECPLSYMANLEWAILKQGFTNQAFESNYGDKFSQVVFSLVMKRNPTYYALNTVFPIILLHLVGLMIFLLPAESGEKVSFSMACLMSFFITQLLIAEQVPRSWIHVPVIMVFNFSFLLLTGISVAVAVLVVNLQSRSTPVPGWLECIFERDNWRNLIWWCLKNGLPNHTDEKNHITPPPEIYKIGDEFYATHEQIKNSHHDSPMKDKDDLHKWKSDYKNEDLALLETLQKISYHLDSKEKEECLRHKWKEIGRKVNKILLFFYIFAGFLMILLCTLRWLGLPSDA